MIETPVTDDAEDDVGKKMMISGKILERMVNQNSCFEIAQGWNFAFLTLFCMGSLQISNSFQIFVSMKIQQMSLRTMRGHCFHCGSLLK